MSTPLRRHVTSVLFDKPRKGWVALKIDANYAPVGFVPVPCRPFAYANDIVETQLRTVKDGRPLTAWGRKHVAGHRAYYLAHYGRWGVYASIVPGRLLVIAEDHETLIAAVITAKERNYARF